MKKALAFGTGRLDAGSIKFAESSKFCNLTLLRSKETGHSSDLLIILNCPCEVLAFAQCSDFGAWR